MASSSSQGGTSSSKGRRGRSVSAAAILAGPRDPLELAKLCDERCKRGEEEIALALQGNWREEHLFALKQVLGLYRFYHRQLSELDERVESCLKTFEDHSAGQGRVQIGKLAVGERVSQELGLPDLRGSSGAHFQTQNQAR